MAVVPAVAVRLFADSGEVLLLLIPAPQPREILLVPHGFLPTVLLPFNVGLGAQDAGAFLASGDVLGEEGADVQAHAVVNVRMPPDGLVGERLPADEEVVGRLTFEDEFEAELQLLGGLEAGVAAGLAGVHGSLLAADPIAEVGVGELFEIGVGELVIVQQLAEAVLVAVPEVPEEGTMVEERAMLLKKLVSQPL